MTDTMKAAVVGEVLVRVHATSVSRTDCGESKIDTNTIDQLVSEFGEMNIDVVSEGGGKAQVRITCE